MDGLDGVAGSAIKDNQKTLSLYLLNDIEVPPLYFAKNVNPVVHPLNQW